MPPRPPIENRPSYGFPVRARVTWALMLEGFSDACGRLAIDVDADVMFKQIFEAVAWAAGAREYLRVQRRPWPPELEAVWVARNLAFYKPQR
jgi:hypothetical protein